jgi:hypothetical protein
MTENTQNVTDDTQSEKSPATTEMYVLTSDQVDVIQQALSLLHNYYVADVDSSNTMADDELDRIERTNQPDDTPDLIHARGVHEESNEYCRFIRGVQKVLGKGKVPDEYK